MRYGLAIYPKSKEALRSLQCCRSRLLFHLVFKGALNVNLTHLLYVEQNFIFLEIFTTLFRILPLLNRKIFAVLFPAIFCISYIFKIIFESLIHDCSCAMV